MHTLRRHVHRQAGVNCTDAKLYFWTIFQLFLSEWDQNPPTHFQFCFGCLECFNFAKPLTISRYSSEVECSCGSINKCDNSGEA